MKLNTCDRYAHLEAIWKSTPYKVRKPTGLFFARRTRLEDKLLEYSREQLSAILFYIRLWVHLGVIKDKQAASSIHTIIEEVLADGI